MHAPAGTTIQPYGDISPQLPLLTRTNWGTTHFQTEFNRKLSSEFEWLVENVENTPVYVWNSVDNFECFEKEGEKRFES